MTKRVRSLSSRAKACTSDIDEKICSTVEYSWLSMVHDSVERLPMRLLTREMTRKSSGATPTAYRVSSGSSCSRMISMPTRSAELVRDVKMPFMRSVCTA